MLCTYYLRACDRNKPLSPASPVGFEKKGALCENSSRTHRDRRDASPFPVSRRA